jgi:hypothetical protein
MKSESKLIALLLFLGTLCSRVIFFFSPFAANAEEDDEMKKRLRWPALPPCAQQGCKIFMFV